MFASTSGAGARAEYVQRFSKAWSAYGAGVVEMSRDTGAVDWQASAGLKGVW